MQQERRNFSRAKRVMTIEYRLASDEKNHSAWHISSTKDMSVSGLTFISVIPLKNNDRLDVRVAMSGLIDIFNGQAKVVRVEQRKNSTTCFIAIQFIDSTLKKRLAKSYQSTVKKPIKKRNAKRIV